MKYLVFNTEQEAIKAELAISKSMNYPSQETKTERWAVPFQLADGRWVFVSPTDDGEEISNELLEIEQTLSKLNSDY
jgi:hypothetical protein